MYKACVALEVRKALKSTSTQTAARRQCPLPLHHANHCPATRTRRPALRAPSKGPSTPPNSRLLISLRQIRCPLPAARCPLPQTPQPPLQWACTISATTAAGDRGDRGQVRCGGVPTLPRAGTVAAGPPSSRPPSITAPPPPFPCRNISRPRVRRNSLPASVDSELLQARPALLLRALLRSETACSHKYSAILLEPSSLSHPP